MEPGFESPYRYHRFFKSRHRRQEAVERRLGSQLIPPLGLPLNQQMQMLSLRRKRIAKLIEKYRTD